MTNSSFPTRPASMASQETTTHFMNKVYAWMTGGILVSGAVAHFVVSSPEITQAIFGSPLVFGLIIAELICVLTLSWAIRRISSTAAAALYLLYCALTGATLSVLFFAYTKESIFNVFAITAVSFAGLSAFGSVTKRDLGPVGSFCMMGLFGLIAYGFIALFFPSLMGPYQMVSGFAGIIIFSGLTAYDTQKIKALHTANAGIEVESKEAIFGALRLYLDFINLFLSLLRLMGRRK